LFGNCLSCKCTRSKCLNPRRLCKSHDEEEEEEETSKEEVIHLETITMGLWWCVPYCCLVFVCTCSYFHFGIKKKVPEKTSPVGRAWVNCSLLHRPAAKTGSITRRRPQTRSEICFHIFFFTDVSALDSYWCWSFKKTKGPGAFCFDFRYKRNEYRLFKFERGVYCVRAVNVLFGLIKRESRALSIHENPPLFLLL
jgi:hypothetical protein